MKITDLQVLLTIAELRSITAAAHKLDMSSSATSVALKKALNLRLIFTTLLTVAL